MRQTCLRVWCVLMAASAGLVTAPSTASAADTAAEPAETMGLYLGFSMIPVSVEGLADIHASDWQTCGLGGGGNCPEGRVSLPMGAGNTGVPLGFGVRVGFQYPLMQSLDIDVEVGVHFGSVLAVAATAGIDWFFVSGESWRLGLNPKVGVLFGTMNFGAARQIPGYVPPVITPEGTFNDGDDLSATMLGFLIDAGLSFEYDFTAKWTLRTSLGFQYAVLGDLDVTAGDVTIAEDSGALVKPDGTSNQAGIDPQGGSLGASLFLGVVYHL